MKHRKIEKVVIHYDDGTYEEIKNNQQMGMFSRPSCYKCGKQHGNLPCQYWDSFFYSNEE